MKKFLQVGKPRKRPITVADLEKQKEEAPKKEAKKSKKVDSKES